MSETNKLPPFRYQDGKVLHHVKGVDRCIAVYDETSGEVEYQSASDADMATQVNQALSIELGPDGQPRETGRIITGYKVKGKPIDVVPKNAPPRPKPSKFRGDADPAYVEWMFKYKPQEAYIVYGVRLDDKGQPVRADFRRRVWKWVDAASGADGMFQSTNPDLKGIKGEGVQGGKMHEPVYELFKNQMWARRATHMTFAPDFPNSPDVVIGGKNAHLGLDYVLDDPNVEPTTPEE